MSEIRDASRVDGLYPPAAEPSKTVLSVPRYLARFIDNPLRAIPQVVYDEPLVFYGSEGEARIAWVTRPDLVEEILLTQAAAFPKTEIDRRIFRPSLGEGILTAEGERWRWQRKLAAPLFRHGEILSYVPAISAAGAAQLARWHTPSLSRAAGSPEESHTRQPKERADSSPQGSRTQPPEERRTRHQIDHDMTATTFDVITSTILAGCEARQGDIIQSALDEMLKPISWDIAFAMLRLPEWLWHPYRRRVRRSAAMVRAAVGELVARRRASGGAGDDILGRLLRATRPETGEPMTDAELVDNLTTFLAAGHETTAKALTWALYLLARAPDWQHRVRDEVRSVTGGGPVEAHHVAALTCTTRVVKETLRLYPPAPVLSRGAIADTRVGPYPIRAGMIFIIPIYAMHRHRKLWDDPDRFDPDRFLPEREAALPRAQFMPFGFGPRTCIGASFALVEAVTLLATLVTGARFEWDGQHTPEPVSRVTLRPKGGMPLYVTPL